MEINLIDEEPLIEIINGQKTLKYDVKYNGKNIDKIPVYKHWLDMMKTENGDNGIVCYCVNCHVFSIFKHLNKDFYSNIEIVMILTWLNFVKVAVSFITAIQYAVINLDIFVSNVSYILLSILII